STWSSGTRGTTASVGSSTAPSSPSSHPSTNRRRGMPVFDAYYAGPECGDQYAKTPQSVTFKCLGKTHLYAAAVTADTPDDAYDQLRQGTPDALERSYRYAPKRPMGA